MKRSALPFSPRKILVLRMSGVGDVLWTTPFLANLRQAFPMAHIGYVVRQSCAAVLDNNRDVDELFTVTPGPWREGWRLLERIRNQRFDLAIDLVGTPRTALQTWWSGAPLRVSFNFGYRRIFYNHVLSKEKANFGHEVDFNLSVLEALGLQATTRDLVFNLTDDETTYRDRTLTALGVAESDTAIGLVPTGGWACKRWPIGHYVQAFRQLLAVPGRKALVFWGGPAEQTDARSIAEQLGGTAVPIPQTTLRQMAALLSRCRIVIGNDSGPLHIATALKVPVVAFYGPTNPRSQGPYGPGHVVLQDASLQCLGCNRMECGEPRCMTGIEPARAVAAATALLGNT